MALPVQSKDPSEVLDYKVEWAGPLGGDTITASSWAVDEGTVTLGANTHDTDSATVWVSGGTAGEICVLTNTVTTANSRTFEQSIKLRVVQK